VKFYPEIFTHSAQEKYCDRRRLILILFGRNVGSELKGGLG
jgi:hypothetical protein